MILSMTRSRLFSALRASLSLLGLGYFVFALWKIDWAHILPSLGWSLLLSPLFLLSLALTQEGFRRLASPTASCKDRIRVQLAYLESWLARYIPGPSAIIYKAVSLGQLNWTGKRLRRVIGFDILATVLATLLGGVPAIVYWVAQSLELPKELAIASWFFPLLGLIIVPILSRWEPLFGAAAPFYLGSRIPLALAAGLSAMLSGVAAIEQFPAIASAFLGAILIGIAALFVPSGIGVRESAFVVALQLLGFPIATAALLALMLRISSIISDTGVLLYVLGHRIKIKRAGRMGEA